MSGQHFTQHQLWESCLSQKYQLLMLGVKVIQNAHSENFLCSLKSIASVSKTQRQKMINAQGKNIQRGYRISTIKEHEKPTPRETYNQCQTLRASN